MPEQSIFRIIKRWRRYQARASWTSVPKRTRGLYVLYDNSSSGQYNVIYIGVAGLGKGGTGGIWGRLKSHSRKKSKKNGKKTKKCTHYPMFEVHDNITRDEIRELESLLLAIFRHDPRIALTNKQQGSTRLYRLRSKVLWKAS